MEKIKISSIVNEEKYKTIIETEVNGESTYLYVLNPTKEQFDKYYDMVYNSYSEDGDEGENVEKIYKEMFNDLTNVELDCKITEIPENVKLLELLFSLKEIYDEIIVLININLISMYSDERVRIYEEKLKQAVGKYSKKIVEVEK